MSDEKFLVTGSMGCIGTWVLRNLIDRGAEFVAADLSTEPTRARLIMSDAEVADINWAQLDVTDGDAVKRMVADNGVTHIVHLAGLQIPFCKANPSMGSAVNVTGTINVFEAARHHDVRGLCYASSLAVLGPAECYPNTPVRDDVPLLPTTLYGVYKAANEGTSKIYWQDWQVGSIGLRPYIVYGVARDQGMSSDLAKAVLAIAADKPFHIRFDGPVALQHANDTAQIFIGCASAEHQGATSCNLRGDVVEVSEYVSLLDKLYPGHQITYERNAPLPYPADLDDRGLSGILGRVPYTSLETAIGQDMERFRQLLVDGKVDMTQLET
jgi:UDP-glucuronate 4-epimerase